jgi:putative nucleotidyltransferase with HDIG domain
MRAFQPVKSIRAKTALLVLLLVLVTTSVAYLITSRIMDNHVTAETVTRAESLSRSIASAAGFNILSLDLLGLDNLVSKIKDSNPDIERIVVIGPEGDVIVHSSLGETEEAFKRTEGPVYRTGGDGTVIREVKGAAGSGFEIESPIVHMKKNLGSVILAINRSALAGARDEARRKILWLFGIVLVLGMTGSLLLSSNLARPVNSLLAGIEDLKRGRRSGPLKVYSHDELGRLTASFNEMSTLITTQQDKLGRYAQDLEEAYISTIRVLAAAIDARDHYTLGHSTRVSDLAVKLAREAGVEGQDLEEIEIACLFHDVGKIRVPDSILHKQGPLTAKERTEMKKHAEYGSELLSKAPSLYKYIPAVRHHHEWYDGSGYPDGLAGDKIPKPAAIVSLADAFDAMTSDRPYRRAMTRKEAVAKIESAAGTQFDPALVGKFLAVVARQGPGHEPGDSPLRGME